MGLFKFFKKKEQEPCPYLCGGGVTSWYCDHTPAGHDRIKLNQNLVIILCNAKFKRFLCLRYYFKF